MNHVDSLSRYHSVYFPHYFPHRSAGGGTRSLSHSSSKANGNYTALPVFSKYFQTVVAVQSEHHAIVAV
jgi:hypothetical protein